MAKSKALPFLEAPKKLDGSLVGDMGFDPMGISDQARYEIWSENSAREMPKMRSGDRTSSF